MDDSIEIRNGDMDRILATVAQTAIHFLGRNPQINLLAAGSSATRTRKYQMGISKNLEFLSDRYHVFGLVADKNQEQNFIGNYPVWQGRWSEFKRGEQYDAFLICLK